MTLIEKINQLDSLHGCIKRADVLQIIQQHLSSPEVVEAAFNSVPRWLWIVDHGAAFKAALQAMGGLSRTNTIDSCAVDDRGLPATLDKPDSVK